MNQETFVARVMRALPELDQEDQQRPGIKEAFASDIARKYSEGWSITDAITYHRLTEEIDCWAQAEDGSWQPRAEEEMLPEDYALARMATLTNKYKK